MTQWSPEQRDKELRTIRSLTTGLVIGSVGATLVLCYGIAWGDQQRVDQADARDAAQNSNDSQSGGSSTTPSKSSSSSSTTKKPKSKSGGS